MAGCARWVFDNEKPGCGAAKFLCFAADGDGDGDGDGGDVQQKTRWAATAVAAVLVAVR